MASRTHLMERTPYFCQNQGKPAPLKVTLNILICWCLFTSGSFFLAKKGIIQQVIPGLPLSVVQNALTGADGDVNKAVESLLSEKGYKNVFPDISRSFSVFGSTILMDEEGEGKAKSKRNF